jgi:hypothetical protein
MRGDTVRGVMAVIVCVRNGGKCDDAGYIVVSAKKTNYPILEFSKGKSPVMRVDELGHEG